MKGRVKDAGHDGVVHGIKLTLFIYNDPSFGQLYIKKLRNTATTPKGSTKGSTG